MYIKGLLYLVLV